MTELTLGQGSDKHQNVLPRTVVEDANYPPNGPGFRVLKP